jgi:hypothetical protein
MKNKTKKIILAVAVIGAVAAGGVAFTAANDVPSSVAGYGQASVTGADLTTLTHTLSDDGTHIITTDMILSGDHTAEDVKAGFGTALGANEDLVSCAVDALVDGSGNTPVSCDWTTLLTPAVVGHLNDATAETFAVAVTGPSS